MHCGNVVDYYVVVLHSEIKVFENYCCPHLNTSSVVRIKDKCNVYPFNAANIVHSKMNYASGSLIDIERLIQALV